MASPSLVDQSQPSDSHHHDLVTTTYTDVDTRVYAAAASGVIMDVFKERREDLINFLTPNRNTVLHLHIAASSAVHATFVKDILELCPALLAQANAKGETPLHLAARYGHARLVEMLIARAKAGRAGDLEIGGNEAAKQMLRATSEEKDTPLHEAVRFRRLPIVQLLTKEDPEFSYPANKAGETPLYIAAERNYSELVAEILDNCASPAADGACGRTALHAATIAKDEASTRKILEKLPSLTRATDDNGWIPLHYAADLNYISIVKALLESDADAAYIADAQRRTAHHIAALSGHHQILIELAACRPGCCELVDDRGCNILHLAVESNSPVAVTLILNENLLSHLLYEKNRDGNTPLHHAAALHRPGSLGALMSSPRYARVDKEAFNADNKNVRDIVFTDDRLCSEKTVIRWSFALFFATKFGRRILDRKDQDVNWRLDEHDPRKEEGKQQGKDDPELPELEKAREASMIAATLIATVTFTAGFTLPGGYAGADGPSPGSAVLRRNAAFKAFMVTDTAAFVLSSLAVFLHLYVAMSGSNKRRLEDNFQAALMLTTLAIAAMILAFVTGTYAMLERFDLLASATCVLGLSFFVFFGVAAYQNECKSKITKIRNRIYYKNN